LQIEIAEKKFSARMIAGKQQQIAALIQNVIRTLVNYCLMNAVA